jgi:hypothetical protein
MESEQSNAYLTYIQPLGLLTVLTQLKLDTIQLQTKINQKQPQNNCSDGKIKISMSMIYKLIIKFMLEWS